MDKFAFLALNIALNSLLAFLTTWLLIELLVKAFRIKPGRTASNLRMIPLLKLAVDPFMYNYSLWGYSQGINPLQCEEGSRTLSMAFGAFYPYPPFFYSGIQLHLPGELTFTLADVLGHLLPALALRCFAILFALTTVTILINQLRRYFKCSRQILDLKQSHAGLGKQCRRIRNSKLLACMKRHAIEIYDSPSLHGSPFVIGFLSHRIFIPKEIDLSRKEYEAVLAHEMEHIRHKDSLIKWLLSAICTIFWWIPTLWLQNRIESGQELGCDLRCKKYGVNPIDLAAAICKVAKQSNNGVFSGVNPQFALHLTKHPVQTRIEALLMLAPPTSTKVRFILTALAVNVAFFGIFLGRYWIF